MRWRKLGLVFAPENVHDWMRSHAANTAAERIDGELYRIYFSTRGENNRSSIGWVEVDMRHPTRVLRVSEHPVVSPGAIGTFDDSGASMACLVSDGNTRYLYYLGWNLGVTVPWRNSIGLAIARDGSDHFEKWSAAPVMDRGPTDPYSISYPWVVREGDRWRMWYGSNLSWGTEQRDMAHLIKYAESDDGIHWRRDGRIAIPFAAPDEYAMSKPCVFQHGGRYRMWYSYRGTAYRIGYAESPDGLAWTRLDHLAGIGPSETGWDAESVEYPNVFRHEERTYMLYNGNGYGRTGFGIAILEGSLS
ncbi:MAG TPA: hypothetical protein VHA15_01870 [Burkholderiales bacterium]|jgi:predicted GH43/DUF377 family glycosyl hydrolase|nr:hypothetical protein [Burkholderiales bacterium]